jgi:hypothetical protein
MEAPDGAFLRETPVTCEGRQCSRALSAHGLVNLKQAGQSRSCIEWERGGPGRRRKPTWWRASIAEGRLWQQGPCAKTHARVNTWTHCLGSVKSMYEHTTTRCATLRGGGNTSKPPGARGVKGGEPNGRGEGVRAGGGKRGAISNFFSTDMLPTAQRMLRRQKVDRPKAGAKLVSIESESQSHAGK